MLSISESAGVDVDVVFGVGVGAAVVVGSGVGADEVACVVDVAVGAFCW